MPSPSYELVLFDVDHTLLDFEASEDHALGLCWEHFFRDAIGFDTYADAFRKINLKIWHEVEASKLKPSHVSEERARRSLKHFGFSGGRAAELGRLFAQGLSEVAEWLPRAEHGFHRIAKRYKVGLITNGLTAVQHPRIDVLGIKPFLSTFQISEEAGTMKPQIGLFTRALEASGCSAENTLMVGDSVSSDFQGSINAQIDFCWVKPNSHELPLGFPPPTFHVGDIQELDALLP